MQQRGRTIGLYGGSFNPAHAGHIYIATEALKRFDIDEIWFLVSPGNPLKRSEGMAPFEDRMASLKSLIKGHPNLRASDLERKLGTRYTADTVDALRHEMPTTNFIWLMGADNLTGFDRWCRWQDIVNALPIAVFDRTGYAISGFASGLARRFAKYRTPPKRFSVTQKPNWTFVTLPRHPASATELRNQHGENWFESVNEKDT